MGDTTVFLENDLGDGLDLNGLWEFRLGDGPPLHIPVPSAWEAYVADKITDGPACYARTFNLPAEWIGRRIVLEALAISFDATLTVNGQRAGHHRGMWSPFQIDITPHVRSGENRIEIEVWKPGRRFPLRECLAGFFPDVCTTFGGIWQPICLRAFVDVAFNDLRITTAGDGRVEARGDIVDRGGLPGPDVSVRLLDMTGDRAHVLASTSGQVGPAKHSFSAHLESHALTRWTLNQGSPSYALEISLQAEGRPRAQVHRPVAFRDIAVVDGATRLNLQPLHLRGVLDWGWNGSSYHPRSLAQDAEQLRSVQALGFNLVKFCLFVPDEVTFEMMDRQGMMVWLEMPMWLPRVTPEFKELALREFGEVFRRLHRHPCIAVVSLGCELNQQADAEFLGDLHALARAWFPNALICDNSGSAETYGGVLTGLSDFYDYHFYADPHFFQPLVQHFSRTYRPDKPWIYGEFCDADTLRDFGRVAGAWWLRDRVTLDRDDFIATREYEQRLGEAGVDDGAAGLTRVARQQAMAVRKYIIEQVRADSATGGYVVMGWNDTPITTSGVVDDAGKLKFAAPAWQPFNADRVLTIDRERRRRWIGGDRPAHRDPFTWWQGEQAEIHLLLSNGGSDIPHARLEWLLCDASGVALSGGASDIGHVPGNQVVEVTVVGARMPPSPDGKPAELTLNAKVTNATPGSSMPPEVEAASIDYSNRPSLTQNAWRLWAIPRPRLPTTVAMEAALLQRHHFDRIDERAHWIDADHAAEAVPLIAENLTEELLDRVRRGASALLWQRQADARFTLALPFWREAIHVFEPHPIWERVPHPGYADMRFFSLATDGALDPGRLKALLGPEARLNHIWRRFDARKMTWSDYLIRITLGGGQVFVTTLSFEGGLGCQPSTFDTNPMGAWMLATLLQGLANA